VRRLFLSLVGVLAVAGCGGSSDAKPAATTRPSTTTTSSSTTSATTSTTTTTAPASTTTMPLATTTTVPATVAPAAPATGQAIVVSASGYGQSYATLTASDRTDAGWVRRFGPWTARIGRNGFAPIGEKREGDGRAPSGTYGFSFFFGIQANPGIDARVDDPGKSPETMYSPPYYNYGAVIAYNTARTPGLGSAIFLHVSNGTSTAGCVALPQSELLDVLRWLKPSLNPRIRMGVGVSAP
jgi:L,D-peptidoglycan transpeptidase YkuD (ErfK/YbiS/YcfS/YnhG family)